MLLQYTSTTVHFSMCTVSSIERAGVAFDMFVCVCIHASIRVCTCMLCACYAQRLTHCVTYICIRLMFTSDLIAQVQREQFMTKQLVDQVQSVVDDTVTLARESIEQAASYTRKAAKTYTAATATSNSDHKSSSSSKSKDSKKVKLSADDLAHIQEVSILYTNINIS
jgi:hypothetical protein